MVVAPDLRDGRPPEEAEREITTLISAFALLVACRPGGPAPLPSGVTIKSNLWKISGQCQGFVAV